MSLGMAVAEKLDPNRPLDAELLTWLIHLDEDILTTVPPEVTRKGDDRLTIVLNEVGLPVDVEDYIVLPHLTVTLDRKDATHIALAVDMAPEILMAAGTLRMDRPKLTGLYNLDLKTTVRFDAAFTNIRLEPFAELVAVGEAVRMSIRKVTFVENIDESNAMLDGRGEFALTDLVIDDDDGFRVGIGKVSSGYTLSKIDQRGYKSLVDLFTLAEESGGEAVSPDQILTLLAALKWDGIDSTFVLSNLVFAENDKELFKVGSVTTSFGAANAGGKGSATVALSASGVTLTDAGWADMVAENPDAAAMPQDLVPQDIALKLTLENLPYAELLRATVGKEGPRAEQAISAVLVDHGTRLVASDMALKAPKAAVGGDITVGPITGFSEPPRVDGSLTVHGLDVVLAAVKKVQQPSEDLRQLLSMLLVLNGIGEKMPAGDGLLYRVAYPPGGSVMVNDIPLESLAK